jgi:hypothetical protein
MTIRSAKTWYLSWCTTLHRFDAIAVLGAAIVLPILPVALAGEIPPYPYQAPPWMTALRQKMKAPLIVDFKDLPLRKALEKVSAATGVSIRLAAEVLGVAEKPVSLSFSSKEQPADIILSRLSSNFGLTYKLTKEGAVVIGPSQRDTALAEAEWTGEWIEHLRKQRFPAQLTKKEKAEREIAGARDKKAAKERTERIEAQKEAFRSTTISQDFVDASLTKILRALREATKVPLTHDPGIDANSLKLTVKGGRSAEKVLEEVLRSLGLTYTLMENVWYITSPDRVHEKHGFVLWREEREAAQRKIFAQKLTRDLKGSRVCDFVKALAADLGVKIFPDSRAWETEVKFTTKTLGLTVKQLAALLKRKGIEVVIEPSAAPYQRRHVPESVGRQLEKPPGLPDVDWSIYLLHQKR